MSFRRFRLLLALAAALCAAAWSVAAPSQEKLEEFARVFRASFSERKVENLMQMIWWQGADKEAHDSFERAFRELSQRKLATVSVVRPPPDMSFGFVAAGRVYEPNLEVVAVLELEIIYGEGADAVIFTYQYPLGVGEGKIWISATIKRGRAS